VQTLEDVICIVFVKYELEAFAGRYAEDDTKLADILAKTWRKMSERGHQAVLALPPARAWCRCSIKVLRGFSLQSPDALSKRGLVKRLRRVATPSAAHRG